MTIHLYHSGQTGNAQNCRYPHRVNVVDEDSMRAAVSYDHVAAEYRDNYRSQQNFIQADTIPMDCDNDHSNVEQDWVDPLDVALAFPDIAFYIVYSRNHMRPKGRQNPRPRFHVYFPCTPMDDQKAYAQLKAKIAKAFPYFDGNAVDSARFFFGVPNPVVEFYSGKITIDQFKFPDMQPQAISSMVTVSRAAVPVAPSPSLNGAEPIPQGKRNKTMYGIACQLNKRYGNTLEAQQKFLKASERCVPPLDERELDKIWCNGVKFGEKVANEDDYIPPELYGQMQQQKSPPLASLYPNDDSDVGQALVFSREYGGRIRYSTATDYLVYNGSYWEESKVRAHAYAQDLTERQLKEAAAIIQFAEQQMEKNGAMKLIANHGERKALERFSKDQLASYHSWEQGKDYEKFAVRRRSTRAIDATLTEAQPMVVINPASLNTDPFLLNTPSVTYDLRSGTAREHNPNDFITYQTAVDPSEDGKQLWEEALNTFFQGDADHIRYVQEVAGLIAIGKVFQEALIIAYGSGSNGKSSFFNALMKVMGTYAVTLSTDALTHTTRSTHAELAELKGKRVALASELDQEDRLNASKVKKLCSTDMIHAEKKYRDPFAFIPSHSLILCTNHLPKVRSTDEGTWRRLIVVPFTATIKGKTDIKNYADYLFDHAGGAILTWIIEGAKRVIANGYHITPSKAVEQATENYREENDWLSHFLESCCELDVSYVVGSGELYNSYRSYCFKNGEHVLSKSDFKTEIEKHFHRHKSNKGTFVHGVRLKDDSSILQMIS